MSSRIKALLVVIFVSLLWSTAGLAKILIRELGPYFAAFLRALIASLVILPLFLREKIVLKKMLRDVLPLSFVSAGNILLYYLGLAYSTANAGALINAGIPFVTVILAHFLIRERITLRKITGITIGFIGVLLITLLPVLAAGEAVTGHITGNMFFLIQIFFWALYTTGSRHLTSVKGYSPVTLSSVSFFSTTVFFGLISIFTVRPHQAQAALIPSNMLLLLYLSIFVTVATYLLYQWVIKRSSATVASLSSYIGPVFAVIINNAVLGESVTPAFLLGSVFVFTGLIIVGGKGVLREVQDLIKR